MLMRYRGVGKRACSASFREEFFSAETGIHTPAYLYGTGAYESVSLSITRRNPYSL